MSEDLFKNVKFTDSKKSVEWYRRQVSGLGASPTKLMSNTKKLTTRVLPGKMYMFFYDAKFKDVLPYWDKFPLVLPFRKVPDGFYGINLHYLPYGARFKILNVLNQIAESTGVDENKRLLLNWRILNSSSSLDPIKSCVKHYLEDYVQSRFLEVNYQDWVTAAMLPVEQFTGASKNKVWQDTRKYI